MGRDKKKKEAAKKKAAKKKKEDDGGEGLEKEKAPEDKTDAESVQTDDIKTEPTEAPEQDPPAEKEAGEDAGSNDEDEEGTTKDKKKKKKKKKKTEEEEKSKKVKKPGKSAILKMQEALEEVKREEQRLIAEAEAKQKALEEAENQRIEKL